MNIHLGYEVGTGKPVEIPVGHMVITGMTQQSGKTTTLEALIKRSGRRAITFITKHGEGAFAGGHRIDPFFREKADWVFVSSLIDATLGEKNKLLRAWLMKVCRNTRTLAEVQSNVRAAKATAKGFSESIYTEIEGYLDLVVPQLAKLPPSSVVQFGPGLNVMDVSPYSTELQALVIRSVIEHISDCHETSIITVIPEAWETLPEGRGSPVKREAETLIRKGACLGNFVWLDSQDLAGVWKTAVRAAQVFLIGVQREANEIKRTIANIPAGINRPSASDIARLERGQFYTCWGKHVIRVYVQPAWMGANEAKAISLGHFQTTQPPKPKENTVTKDEEAISLRQENERLKKKIDELLRPTVTTPSPPPNYVSYPPTKVFDPKIIDDAIVCTEEIVQEVIERVIKSPPIIALQRTKPEIEVTITRKTITLDEFSLKGRIARLLSEGFFREPKGPSAIRSALKRTGPDANTANIGRSMDDFTRDGFTTDEGNGYREVPGMEVNIIKQ